MIYVYSNMYAYIYIYIEIYRFWNWCSKQMDITIQIDAPEHRAPQNHVAPLLEICLI